MKKSLFAFLILVGACQGGPVYKDTYELDREMAKEIFLKCIESSHAPNSITAAGNDADEVVDQCRAAAHSISGRLIRTCVANCDK